MKFLVGLGNPGAKYAQNRHNVGFLALDEIAADHGFSPWRNKFQAEICEGHLGGTKVLLMKPQTFMNRSGQAVGEAMRFYKGNVTDVTVLHDELDLAPGKCKLKFGGGHAGHNGLRSIHDHVGPHYARVRIGIGHPGDKAKVSGYVLHDFASADQTWLSDLLRGISKGAASIIDGDAAAFGNALSDAMPTPPRKPKKARPVTQAPRVENKVQSADEKSKLQQLLDRFR